MNAREEIEDLLVDLREVESHTPIDQIESRVDRIRAILAAHDLVPIGEMSACSAASTGASRMNDRWLKPSEVTEPGAYWVADLLDREMIVTNVLHYRFGLDGLGYKSRGRWVDCNDPVRWEERHRLLGPITPPEYTGDWK